MVFQGKSQLDFGSHPEWLKAKDGRIALSDLDCRANRLEKTGGVSFSFKVGLRLETTGGVSLSFRVGLRLGRLQEI